MLLHGMEISANVAEGNLALRDIPAQRFVIVGNPVEKNKPGFLLRPAAFALKDYVAPGFFHYRMLPEKRFIVQIIRGADSLGQYNYIAAIQGSFKLLLFRIRFAWQPVIIERHPRV